MHDLKVAGEGSWLSKAKEKLGRGKDEFTGLAIVWNNRDAKPVSDTLGKRIPRKYLDLIPQGHAGLIIVGSDKRATTIDFGAGSTWGCKNDEVGWQRTGRASFGILTHGGFRVIRSGGANIGQDGGITHNEAKRLLANSPLAAAQQADEWGVILNYNADAVLSKVGSNKSTCAPYAIVPVLPSLPGFLKDDKKKWFSGGGLMGENCGSMALKLATSGMGSARGLPARLAGNLIYAPDQVVGLLRNVRAFSISS